jgi:L-rhamnose mutarotase
MKTYCFALDLKNDALLIAEYKRYHETEHIWPEVVDSIKSHGVLREQIFLLGTRMVLVLFTSDEFELQEKAQHDLGNVRLQDWEKLMWSYQQSLPEADPTQKWVQMDKIFDV